MTREEEKIMAGVLFCPGDPELRAIKLKSHNLCSEYNRTFEDETEKRAEIVKQIFAHFGERSFVQGPIAIHYGVHTHIGDRFFGNFNLTIQDDAPVTIGNDCNFGPNVTIATAGHPICPELRAKGLQFNMPVRIGRNCWLGAGVIVMPGVTIGDNVVIGAGSIVTKDIPSNVVAVGNPCRILREVGEHDRQYYYKDRKIPQEMLDDK